MARKGNRRARGQSRGHVFWFDPELLRNLLAQELYFHSYKASILYDADVGKTHHLGRGKDRLEPIDHLKAVEASLQLNPLQTTWSNIMQTTRKDFKLGLSMVVKNEEVGLKRCLGSIFDLFDDITIVDTGSTDATRDILENKLGIRPLTFKPNPQGTDDEKSWEPGARNLSLAANRADWVLVLDADEVISREDIEKIKSAPLEDAGYFIKWKNRRDGRSFDDYKLALIKTGLGIRYDSFIHCNPQLSFRRLGLHAKYFPDVIIEHEQRENANPRNNRIERLADYAAAYPEHHRYKWFLGYTLFKNHRLEEAIAPLSDCASSFSDDFPIECLNAHIVLSEIFTQSAAIQECRAVINQAQEFYERKKQDFEMVANPHLSRWLAEAESYVSDNTLAQVKAYEFAY